MLGEDFKTSYFQTEEAFEKYAKEKFPSMANLDENKISRDLSELSKIPNPMDMALEMFLFCARGQFFYDGNKRLATLMTNKIMIQNGLGIFSVPIKFHSQFYQLLVSFYESKNKLPIKQFLYDNCISGVSF